MLNSNSSVASGVLLTCCRQDKSLDVGLITKIFLIGHISSIVIGPFSGAFVDRLVTLELSFDYLNMV